MSSYRTAFWLATAGLCASLSLHAWRWRSAHVAAPASPPASTAAAATTAPPSAAPAPAEMTRLRAQLAACRNASWELVAKAIEGQTVALPQAGDGTRPTTQPSARPAGFAAQQQTLCQLAQAQLRKHFEAERANLIEHLGQVGGEQWVDEDVRKKVAAQRRRFELDERDTKRVEHGYRRLWERHGRQMAQLVADEDWTALLVEAQSFWRDEDNMISSLLGGKARMRYRNDELGSRTAIAAILAALAELPWDEAIAW